jgi:hypothetical protein
VGGEPGGTSAPIHGLRYLFRALRREGLIADELVLQLATFLRSLYLFLELIVLTPRTLTANQVRCRTALIEGRLSTASAKDELVKLATRLIVEEALEGEATDAVGRE